MIICDTREKANQRILQYFDEHGVPYTERKLETGDYMDSDNPNTVVERKNSLDELMTNLFTEDKTRFQDEIRRAHKEGLKLIILCEHGGIYKSIKDVAGFKSRYSRVSGRRLMEKLYSLHIAYGVEFLFCDKRSTGRRILEILGGAL